MEPDQIRVEEAIVESTDAEMHLSIKLRGILRPKSVRRTLVIGLIYGPSTLLRRGSPFKAEHGA